VLSVVGSALVVPVLGAVPAYAGVWPGATATLAMRTGSVLTVSGPLTAPTGVAVAGGYAYVGTTDAIVKVDLTTGSAAPISGTGGLGYSGCVTAAALNPAAYHCGTSEVSTDGTWLYTLEGQAVRRTSLATTVASTIVNPFLGDGNHTPTALSVGPDGAVYVAFVGKLYRLDPGDGTTTLVVTLPNGDDGRPVTVHGVTADADYVYVTFDTYHYSGFVGEVDRVTPSTGARSAVVTSSVGGLNATGLTSAGDYLYALVIPPDGSGRADVIRRWTKATGAFVDVAGSARGYADGIGAAAMFNQSYGLVSDGTRLWVSDSANNRLRVVLPVKDPAASGGPTRPYEDLGAGPLGERRTVCTCADPVNTATGALTESVTDLAIAGRGPGLSFTRTYDSQAASTLGRTGYGWTDGLATGLLVDPYDGAGTLATSTVVDVVQENGSRVPFVHGTGGYAPPSRVLATLAHNADGTWTYVRRARTTFTFDSTGRLIAIADLDGYLTTLAYDGSGRLATMTDAVSRTLTFAYGTNGLVSSVTDPAGRVVGYGYDAGKNLTSVTDPAGQLTGYGYDATHRLTSVTDPRGNTTTTAYDTFGRVGSQTDRANRTTTFGYSVPTAIGSWTVTVTDPRGIVTRQVYTDGELTGVTRAFGTALAATWTYAYDPVSNGVTATTDPLGHLTSATYDAAGNRLTATDALAHSESWTYDALDEVTSHTDRNGVTTTSTYDAAGHLLTTSTPLAGSSPAVARTTTYAYGDPAHPGDVTAVTDPAGKVWARAYDAFGQLTSTTDPLGHATAYDYGCASGCRDDIGWRYSSVSPRGYTTTWTRDDDGRVLTTVDPLGGTTTVTYDGNGNRHTVIDADGHTTTYTYDADDELTREARANTTTLGTGYDAGGNPHTQTDGAGRVTTYDYDALDRLVAVTDPLSRTTSYGYDLAGRLVSIVDAAGRTTTYGYDAADRRTSVSYSDGVTPGVTYTYDAGGRRLTMADGTGTSSYGWDSLDRLTSRTDGAGQTVGYGYDLAGRLTSLAYPGGGSVARGYDDAGRLTSLVDLGGRSFAFGYDLDSDLTSLGYPNGVTDVRTYDHADRLASIAVTGPAGLLASYGYTRDGQGQVTAATGPAETYGYTTLDQVATVNAGAYGYDAADNPTGLLGAVQTYDGANEVTSRLDAGVTTTYAYTAFGERAGATTSGLGGATTTYGYDQASRLRSVVTATGTTTYGYDGDGLRAAKTVAPVPPLPLGPPVSPTTLRFAYDESGPVPLVLADGLSRYVSGPGGLPVEQVDAAGTPTYLHTDQLGSVRLLTSAAGTSAGGYSYDAYGRPAHTGAATSALGYTGAYTDSGTGLLWLRARYYDPVTAQFLTRDPLTALTRTPYAYAANNPLNHTDPSGLEPINESYGYPGGFGGGEGTKGETPGEGEVGAEVPGASALECEGELPERNLDHIVENADAEVEFRSDTSHIFRDATGHLVEDTAENRALLLGAVRAEYLVDSETLPDGSTLSTYNESLPDGTQVWVEVRNGTTITNGGLNVFSR
jgi:RHS repeat-associated protein